MLCLSYFFTYFRFNFYQNVFHRRFSLSLFIYSFFFSGNSFCQLCWEWSSNFEYTFYTIIWLTQSARESLSFGKDLFLGRLTQSVSRELFLSLFGWLSQQERLCLSVKIYFLADWLSQLAENYFFISYFNLLYLTAFSFFQVLQFIQTSNPIKF